LLHEFAFVLSILMAATQPTRFPLSFDLFSLCYVHNGKTGVCCCDCYVMYDLMEYREKGDLCYFVNIYSNSSTQLLPKNSEQNDDPHRKRKHNSTFTNCVV
jgi:hypothetical protein